MISGMLFGILLALCLVLALLTIYLKKDILTPKSTLPKVSILVAARNEEDNMLECLTALQHLTYAKVEVWVGNDQSTDRTADIVQEFCNQQENFNLLNITENVGTAKGKANVLAQLAHKANGDYFMITDADIKVPPNWVQYMLASFDENTGIASGFTITERGGFMANMQRIDWAYAMGMVKVVSDWKPIVGVGNNMAVSREAYFATGGYENLPFSIVEDYQLFTEITKRGYGYANLLNEGVLATSKPIQGFLNLLQQRKRWMSGAFQLPIWVLGILILQASYYSLIVVMAFLNPPLALNLAALKLFLQAVFVHSIFRKMNTKVSYFQLILFEGYQFVLSTASLLFYFIPVRIKWKGRTY